MGIKKKIMVVDDNTVNLATVEQELKSEYEVIPMLTGRRAIKYLYRERVDLILLDVEMPIMDGIETLKEIRALENGVTIPVIFLTAKRDAQTVVEGSRLGIMDYITKPFDSETLKERIENAFKKLGVTPMEPQEIYDRINDFYNDLLELNIKRAVPKVEEMLQYSMDEAISGRIRNIKMKMERDDIEGALSMTERVLEMMEKSLNETVFSNLIPISLTEISARLLYIQDDLDNFRTADAKDKLKNLMDYDISDELRRNCKRAVEKLKEYDDIEAKAIIDDMIKQVQLETKQSIDAERAGRQPLKKV